jgi:acyl-CoA hydrolase
VDFLRGARASRGGRAILALPSTARGGRESRIRAHLGPAVPVSVARADADLIVTEHGVADLRLASLEERALRVAAVAAPAYRDSLLAEWSARG